MKQSNRSSRSAKRFGVDPIVAFSLAAILLFFIISGAIAFENLQTLRQDSEALAHSQEVLIAVGELRSAAQDAETGQRGFLLTNEEKYLEPYTTATAALPRLIEQLAQLTADNPKQQARVAPLKQHVDAKLAELALTIDLRRTQGLDGALAEVKTDRGKVEMDEIRTRVTEMDQEEAGLRLTRLAEMSTSFRTALASSLFSGLLGVILAGIVGFLVQRAARLRQREEWLQTGQVQLAAAMLGDQGTEQLGDNILGFLARYVGAVAGAVFVGDGFSFQRASLYGAPAGANLPEKFTPRDGLLGRAIAERRTLVLDDVPEGYLTFGSALGQHKPRHLIIAPCEADGLANTVVELGFLGPADADTSELLRQASTPIALAVRSANYRGERERLLEESQRQGEELQAQGEELRVFERGVGGARPRLAGFPGAARATAGRAGADEFSTRGANARAGDAARRSGARQRRRATEGARA